MYGIIHIFEHRFLEVHYRLPNQHGKHAPVLRGLEIPTSLTFTWVNHDTLALERT